MRVITPISTLLRTLVFGAVLLVPFCGQSQVSVFYSDFAGDEFPTEDVVACLDEASFLNFARFAFTVTDNSGGVVIELDLPPGIDYVPGEFDIIGELGSTFTFTRVDISNLNKVRFRVEADDGVIEFGNQFIITWGRVAQTCEAVEFQLAGGTFKGAIRIFHDAGVVVDNDPTVNAYDLLVGSLAISEPEPIEVTFGDTLMKPIEIVNGGLGCVDSFQFWILEESGINTFNIDHVGATIVPEMRGDTLFYIFDTDDFMRAGLGDCFDNGEIIELTRSIAVLDCNTDSEMQAYWGCAGEICQRSLIVDCALPLAGGVPDVIYTGGGVQQASNFCDTSIVNHEFTNDGQVVAYNIQYLAGFNSRGFSLSLDPGRASTGIPIVAACVNGTDVPFSIGQTTATTDTGVVINLGDLSVDPDGPGVGLEDLDGDGQFDDLAPGESYTILLKHLPVEVPGCRARRVSGSYKVATSFTDECRDRLDLEVVATRSRFFQFTLDGDGTVIAPSNVFDNEPFTVMVCGAHRFSGNRGDSFIQCPTSELTLIGRMPIGISLLSSSMTGTSEVSPAVQVGDSVFYTALFDDNAAICFNLELVLDCDALEGSSRFDFQMDFQCDVACDVLETFSCPVYSPVFICGNPCPYGGLTVRSTETQRITTGFPSPTNCDEYVDPATIDPVQLRRVMPHDTFCLIATSRQIPGLSGGPDQTWPNAFLDVSYMSTNRANILEYAGGEFIIWDADLMTYDTFNMPPPVFDNQTGFDHLFTYEFTDSLPAGGLQPNDSINVNLKMKVLKNRSIQRENAARLEEPRVVFYNLVDTIQDNDPDLDKVKCLDLSMELYVHRPEFSTTAFGRPRPRGCVDYAVSMQLSYDGGPGDIYPGEIRPYYSLDSITVEITTCDILNADATVLDSEGAVADGYPSTRLQTFVGEPDRISGDDTLQRFTWYNPGDWPKGDQNGPQIFESGYTFRPSFTPSCRSKDGTIRVTHHAQKYAYAHDTSCYEPVIRTGLRDVTHQLPMYELENLSGNQFASQDTVSWNIDVRNISNVNGFNVWLAFEDRVSSIELLGVRDADADTVIPFIPYIKGDWIRLNEALLRRQTQEIEVTGVISQCPPDSILVQMGWECASFPMDPGTAPCIEDTIFITAEPQLSEVQLAIDRDPELPIDLCSSDTFLVLFNSAQAAFLNEPVFTIVVPQGATIRPVSVEYPLNSGNTEFLTPSVQGNVLTYFIEDHSAVGEQGLPGTLDEINPNLRAVYFNVIVETDCDFTSGENLRFIGEGLRPCGEAAINDEITIRSADIRVEGADPPYLSEFELMIETDSILQGCEPNIISTEITLASFIETATKPNDTLFIILDPGITFDETLFMCTSVDDNTCLEFVYARTNPVSGFTRVALSFPETPIDLSMGVVMTSFDLAIEASSDIMCDARRSIEFRGISTVGDVPCATEPGGFCLTLRTTTGFIAQDFRVRRSVPTFTDFALVCRSTADFAYTGSLTVDSLPVEADQQLILDVYCADDNGDVIGGSVERIFIQGPIAIGDTVDFEGDFDAVCDIENGVIITFDQIASNGEENCICEDQRRLAMVPKCPSVEVGTIETNTICSPDQTSQVFAVTDPDTDDIRGLWGTTGTGFFFDLPSRETEYFWSPEDIANGSVRLFYTLRPTQDSLCRQSDSVDVFYMEDLLPPDIICPAHKHADNDPGQCGAVIDVPELEVFENCTDSRNLLIQFAINDDSLTIGVPDTAFFPVGENTVTIIVTDLSGLADTCMYKVIVDDVDAPMAICPDLAALPTTPWINELHYDNAFADVGEFVEVAGPAGFDLSNCILYLYDGFSGAFYGTDTLSGQIIPDEGDGFGAVVSTFTVGIAQGTEGIALVCDGELLQFISYEGTFTASNGPAAGEMSVDIGVSETVSTMIGTSLQFLGAGTVGSWNPSSPESPGLLNDGQDIAEVMGLVQFETEPGTCAATVSGLSITGADNCDTSLVITNNSPYGTDDASGLYDVGVYSVTYTVTDSAGNSSTCTISFEVVDAEAPVLDCNVINLNQDNTLGECGFIPTGGELDPNFTDNCPGVMIFHNFVTAPDSTSLDGANLPFGDTDILWVAMDAEGNKDSCMITISVTDIENPIFVTCPSNDTLRVGSNTDICEGSAIFSTPIADDNCGLATVTQLSGPPAGESLAVGIYTVSFLATDIEGNTDTCEFTLIVEDTEIPSITCPGNMIVAETDQGACTWTSGDGKLSLLNSFENCPVAITYHIINLDGDTLSTGNDDASGEIFQLGMTQVCYTSIETEDPDQNGMLSDTCCFMVRVDDTESPVIDCPSDETFADSEDNLADCQYISDGDGLDPTAVDNCTVSLFTHNYDAPSNTSLDGAVFPLGTTEVVWTAIDTAGNTSTCVFTITVTDDVTPSIVCPTDAIVTSVNDDCDAQFDWTHPTPVDNCPLGILVDYTVQYTNPDGSVDGPHDIRSLIALGDLATSRNFDVGVTTVEYFVNDPGGNSVGCSFTVTVSDLALPFLVGCPDSSIVVDNDLGWCGAIVNLPTIFGLDGCTGTDSLGVEYNVDGAGWTSVNPSGDFFEADTTLIEVRTIDDAGNIDSCSFDVIVVDKEVPEVVCTNLFFEQANDICSVDITAQDLAALSSDNCGIASIQISTDTLNFFDSLTLTVVGPTFEDIAVIVRVVDSSGNEAFCIAEVSIRCGVTDLCPFVDVEILSGNIACGLDTVSVGVTLDATTLRGQWSTSGDGSFVNDSADVTEYIPGPGDMAGDTILIIYTQDSVFNCQPIDSTILILAVDTEAPSIVGCPVDSFIVENDAGWCGANVNFPSISATDNCDDEGDLTVEYSIDGGPYTTDNPSGDFFEADSTGVQMSIRFTDRSGNADSCEFVILVLDKEAPQAVCQDAVFDIGLLCEGQLTADLLDGGSSDNCGEVSLAISRDGGPFMDSITITQDDIAENFINITLQVTDGAGNTSICVSAVEVTGANVNLGLCATDTLVSTISGACIGQVPNILPAFDSTSICGDIVNVRQIPEAGVLFGGQVGDSIIIRLVTLSNGGVLDTCETVALLVDTEEPTWINCPRPAIVVKSMPGQCGAFVNFSLPTALDNCELDSIIRTDDVGLTSGEMFPVGKTTLRFIAVDASGNMSEECTLDIFVNDGEAPVIECPEVDTVTTDPGLCGAFIDADLIAPTFSDDNCPDHIGLLYTVTDATGTVVACGAGDASSALLPKGTNTVTYTATDQPLLLISEVVQDYNSTVGGQVDSLDYVEGTGSDDYVEITNYGPCSVIISCLQLERVSTASDVYAFEGEIIIPVGQTLVVHYGEGTDSPSDRYFNAASDVDLMSGDAAAYILSINGHVLDVVSTNGFNPVGQGTVATVDGDDWSGNVASSDGAAGIARALTCDMNSGDDWTVLSEDYTASIGSLNDGATVMTDNGSVCTLQSAEPNTATCSFTVVVEDNELPSCDDSLMPLVDVTINNDPGVCGATYSWIHPCISDNCPMGTISVSYINDDLDATTPDDGIVMCADSITEVFGCGTTTVIYTITDMAGNVSNCSFTVTVDDIEPPSFTCPKDWTLTLDPGQCGVIKDFEIEDVLDNCAIDSMIVEQNGQFLPIGDTTITVRIIDKAGNEVSCEFMFTILEFPSTVTELACQDGINLSLGPDCQAEITSDFFLSGNSYGCYDCYTVTIHEDVDSDPIPSSPFVNTEHIGQTLIVMVTDCNTGNVCWGELTVENKIIPDFICPPDTIVPCNGLSNPEFTGFPSLLSCVDNADVTYVDDFSDEGKCNAPRATVVRTWTVTDANGTSVTCVQNILVDRIQLDSVDWPANYDDINQPSFTCTEVALNPSLIDPVNTGFPSIDGEPLQLGVNPFCDITYFVDDEIFVGCGGSYEIQRIWKISNLCEDPLPGVNPIVHIQRILVWDLDGPQVIAPVDVTLQSPSHDCFVNYAVPVPTVVDECSEFDYTISATDGTILVLGPNQFVLSDLTEGETELSYFLQDECGNVSVHTVSISVEDNFPPVPVCDENTVVSLNESGTALVFAETFDDGSHDNCRDVFFKVRRNPGPNRYDDDVSFTCSDIGREIEITLRVFDVDPGPGVVNARDMRPGGDLFGRFNDCTVNITVQDKLPPYILCPDDITLDCGDELDSRALEDPRDDTYGAPIAIDNCSFTVDVEVDMTEAACGEGTITRTFTVTDRGGLTNSCSQQIFLINSDPTTESDIRWPSDVERSDVCLEDLEDDPSVTGEPVVDGAICSDILISFEDELFTNDADACLKIFRTWKVLDWCQYDEDTGAGIWTDLQIIKLSNDIAPVIEGADDTVEACDSAATTCEGFIKLTVTATDDCSDDVDVSYQVDAFDDGDIDVIAPGADASGTYPFGRHRIIWTAEDGCGNTTVVEQIFILEDCKKPSPKCFSGLVTVIMESVGEVTIWATDFDAGSDDNCGDVTVSFSEDVDDTNLSFTCNELGTQTLQLWVTDAAGNQDFCETFIFIQDNNDVCDSISGTIAGIVYTKELETVEGVEVDLSTTVGLLASMLTPADGAYIFENQPHKDDYLVSAFKNDDPKNGISTFDIVKIQKHILGLERFTSPYEYIAADVNNNQAVSALDISELRKLLLGAYSEFPENTSWRFSIKDQTFDDPTSPWPFIEIVELIDFTAEEDLDNNFIAIKVGDLTGDAATNSLLGTEDRTDDEAVILTIEEQQLDGSQMISIPVRARDFRAMLGYQLTWKWDAQLMDFESIESGALEMHPGLVNTLQSADGLMSMSWSRGVAKTIADDEVLFTLTFSPMMEMDINLSDIFSISDDITTIEAYSEASAELTVAIDWTEPEAAVTYAWSLEQNTPNPFDEQTQFEISLGLESDVTIAISDELGRVVKVIEGVYGAGVHSISVKRSELGAGGVYPYELTAVPTSGAETYTEVKKMIVVD